MIFRADAISSNTLHKCDSYSLQFLQFDSWIVSGLTDKIWEKLSPHETLSVAHLNTSHLTLLYRLLSNVQHLLTDPLHGAQSILRS